MTRAAALLIACIAAMLVILPSSARALDIQEVTTENGLKVLLVEDHSLPIIALSFAFRSGSAQEPAGKEGALNLMASLLDEGAGSYTGEAYQNRLEDLATHVSFNPDRDYLYGGLKTLSANRDAGFEMLRLALFDPHFDEKILNRIRDQILAGVRARENDPGSKAAKAMRELIYPEGHAYRRTTEGSETSLLSLTRDDLGALRQRIMARDNLILSVVGDITPEEVRKTIDRLFGDLPEKAALIAVPAIEPHLGDMRHVVYEQPQTRFAWVSKGIARDDPDYMAAYLVNQVLGGSGLTSRLSNEVREKRGLAYGISTSLSNARAVSLFTGSVATRSDFADETLRVMKAEMHRMAEEGPTEAELALMKSYTIGAYALNFDGASDIARTLTGLQVQGLPANYIDTRAALISAVTLDDAKRAAKRLLGDGNYALVRLGPLVK